MRLIHAVAAGAAFAAIALPSAAGEFAVYDVDGDGAVDVNEFAAALSVDAEVLIIDVNTRYGLTQKDIAALFARHDADSDGDLDEAEFSAFIAALDGDPAGVRATRAALPL